MKLTLFGYLGWLHQQAVAECRVLRLFLSTIRSSIQLSLLTVLCMLADKLRGLFLLGDLRCFSNSQQLHMYNASSAESENA